MAEPINTTDLASAHENWVIATRQVQANIERICLEIDAILTGGGMNAGWDRVKLPWGYQLSVSRFIVGAHVYLHQSPHMIDTNPHGDKIIMDEWAVRMLVADVRDGYLDELRKWAKLSKKARAEAVKLGRRARIRSDIAIGVLDAADYEGYNLDSEADGEHA